VLDQVKDSIIVFGLTSASCKAMVTDMSVATEVCGATLAAATANVSLVFCLGHPKGPKDLRVRVPKEPVFHWSRQEGCGHQKDPEQGSCEFRHVRPQKVGGGEGKGSSGCAEGARVADQGDNNLPDGCEVNVAASKFESNAQGK